MATESNNVPPSSDLPEDAERLGLTPLTAPGLQVASSLRPGRRRDKVLAVIALVVILAIVAAGLLSALAH